MAGETADRRLQESSRLRLERLKGALFEAVLLGSTLLGLVALLVLFGYIAFDAFRPRTASATWYLLYLGTLVAPTVAFTLYARRRPAVRRTNAKAVAVVFGALVGSLVLYVVADAVSPYDILLYLAVTAGPPAAVLIVTRYRGGTIYTGPAVTASIVGGIAVATVLYDVLRPLVAVLAEWLAYIGIVTVPVAAILGVVTARRWSRRGGTLVAGGIVAATYVLALGLLVVGRNPAVWIVLFSAFVIPVAYVFGDTILRQREGRVGLAGPLVLLGGVVLGATLERQLAVDGLNGFLTPTLFVNSWDGLRAANAGVYPQIVGSIVVVGFMAVLAFPVGIGAAVYLEEYAPTSGWGGRLASLLEINIANLAGVPSVVYGLLGLALFRNTFGFGTGIVISASGTLGLLILPIVVVSTQEALRAVPDSLREAAYGMGASRWQTLRTVVFPEAIPGTLTGTILALARAIGETAPLVIIAVATTTYTAPEGLFASATALPLQIFAARSNVDPAFRHGVVPATAVILLGLMLAMNMTAIVIRNRFARGE